MGYWGALLAPPSEALQLLCSKFDHFMKSRLELFMKRMQLCKSVVSYPDPCTAADGDGLHHRYAKRINVPGKIRLEPFINSFPISIKNARS